MQYPVPQFTDVEDKIIGPLTVKQFGIIFGAGVLVFLSYTLTKSLLVVIGFALLVGLPALGIAFAKPNGRPMYNMLGYYVSFLFEPKVMVFRKEGPRPFAKTKEPSVPTVAAGLTPSPGTTSVNPNDRMRQLKRLLEEQSKREKSLFKG